MPLNVVSHELRWACLCASLMWACGSDPVDHPGTVDGPGAGDTDVCQAPDCVCEPKCEAAGCGLDGCGGVCNGCYELGFGDGKADATWGVLTQPEPHPTEVLCLQRIVVPAAMTWSSLSIGWSPELAGLGLPFDLIYAPSSAVSCNGGSPETCTVPSDAVVMAGSGETGPPHQPMVVDVPMDAGLQFIGVRFAIPQLPWYVCPADANDIGADSFLLARTDGAFEGLSFSRPDEERGALSFFVRLEQR